MQAMQFIEAVSYADACRVLYLTVICALCQEDASAKIQQQISDRAASRAGYQLVKGTGSKTLAPGNLRAVRERLSMPAAAEFEDHDPWTLRYTLGNRPKKIPLL